MPMRSFVFLSELVAVPYRQSMLTFNTMVREMNPYHNIDMPVEFQMFLERVRRRVLIRVNQIQRAGSNLNQTAMASVSSVFHGRQALLKAIQDQRKSLRALTADSGGAKRIIDPSQIRPVVFLFFWGQIFSPVSCPYLLGICWRPKPFFPGCFPRKFSWVCPSPVTWSWSFYLCCSWDPAPLNAGFP